MNSGKDKMDRDRCTDVLKFLASRPNMQRFATGMYSYFAAQSWIESELSKKSESPRESCGCNRAEFMYCGRIASELPHDAIGHVTITTSNLHELVSTYDSHDRPDLRRVLQYACAVKLDSFGMATIYCNVHAPVEY